MLAGNIALLFLAVGILKNDRPSGLDLAFWLVVIGLLVVRLVDITRLGGTTADGEPTTISHWWRYALRLVSISGIIWGLARLL